ncbi:hypothetical protein MUP77_02270 [Candidatus Bathyarchaeota archaeon]|nr:hypothetical protein [Candidatus Bathyarchaeota archaeon]
MTNKSISVSLENYGKIIELKGQLEMDKKIPKTSNDVITYLFENQKEKKRNEG